MPTKEQRALVLLQRMYKRIQQQELAGHFAYSMISEAEDLCSTEPAKTPSSGGEVATMDYAATVHVRYVSIEVVTEGGLLQYQLKVEDEGVVLDATSMLGFDPESVGCAFYSEHPYFAEV